MEFVDRDQVFVPLELGQMKFGSGGHGLIGRHVALQAPARVGGIFRGPDGQVMAQRRTPVRIDEGFLRLKAQAVARNDPADALRYAGLDQAGGGDHGEKAFAAAGSDGREDVAHVGFAPGDSANDVVDHLLMSAKGPGHALRAGAVGGSWERKSVEGKGWRFR